MKLILGTVQFGLPYGINNGFGKPDQHEVNSILDFAFQSGIRLLDTAEAYGDSQEVIGMYHQQSANKFEIITKFSSKRADLPVQLKERIKRDLETLQVDSLYSYMFHSFSDFKSYFKTFQGELSELKEKGLVKKVGVSVYTNQEIEELLMVDAVDLIQLPFNLLDNNTQRAAMIKKMKDHGKEVHTRSAFLQGLFFMNTNQLPGNLTSLKPYLEKLGSIASAHTVNLNDLSLAYVYQQENIDMVLIGVDSTDQLKRNILSLSTNLTKEIVDQIDLIDVSDTTLLNPSNWNK